MLAPPSVAVADDVRDADDKLLPLLAMSFTMELMDAVQCRCSASGLRCKSFGFSVVAIAGAADTSHSNRKH